MFGSYVMILCVWMLITKENPYVIVVAVDMSGLVKMSRLG
jgi:hypothetical protein